MGLSKKVGAGDEGWRRTMSNLRGQDRQQETRGAVDGVHACISDPVWLLIDRVQPTVSRGGNELLGAIPILGGGLQPSYEHHQISAFRSISLPPTCRA